MSQQIEGSQPLPPPPPPYSRESQTLKPWQRRWNREWPSSGMIKDMRRGYAYAERNRKRNGRSREYLRKRRATAEEWVAEAIQNGAAGEKDTLFRSVWQRITDRFFGPLKREYDDFKEWRRDRKNKDKLWKVTAVMEDVGDNPRWQAEMTFKIRSEHWPELANTRQWFEFPSAENIKWFWVTRPNGYDHLSPPAAESWGPDVRPLRVVTIMPFREVYGRVIRNPQAGISGGNYWHNFC
ncbi:hypothetical protein AAE478_003398 [Parahypoxylon ruwenzoriense]